MEIIWIFITILVFVCWGLKAAQGVEDQEAVKRGDAYKVPRRGTRGSTYYEVVHYTKEQKEARQKHKADLAFRRYAKQEWEKLQKTREGWKTWNQLRGAEIAAFEEELKAKIEAERPQREEEERQRLERMRQRRNG